MAQFAPKINNAITSRAADMECSLAIIRLHLTHFRNDIYYSEVTDTAQDGL